MEDDLIEALSSMGLEAFIDSGGNVRFNYQFIRVGTLKIKMIRRGRYKADPDLVPPEIDEEDNIYWTDEVHATAITEDGEEVPVHLNNIEQQVHIEQEVILPGGDA